MQSGNGAKTSLAEKLSPNDTGLYDIGTCKRVTVHCLSEIGWRDEMIYAADVRKSGGDDVSQWEVEWTQDNAAGSSSVIEVEHLNGSTTRFLLDTGWNPEYIDRTFRREGVDELLVEGKIEFLYISHEHMDHFWGLEAVLRYRPDIPVVIPNTFSNTAIRFIRGEIEDATGAKNRVIHTGPLHRLQPGEVYKLTEGVASVGFDLPLSHDVQGEQSIYAHLADKGMVFLAGCCHQNVLNLAGFARENLVGGDRMYGLYGGLHISPHGDLTPDAEQIIHGMREYKFSKIACNHCTGLPAVEKMRELGLSVETGEGKYGSHTDQHVGNGEVIAF